MFELNDVIYKDILKIKQATIQDRQVTTLFGESGSGKSTLLKMFNRLITPDSGEILYSTKPIEYIDPISLRREVIMMAQSPAIFEGNVRDNLLAGLRFAEKDIVGDDKLVEILHQFQLHKHLTDDAEQLSGGEKQRLTFARVLLMNANVYLLDEPTSALDSETEHTVMDYFIKQVRDNGKTVIMVTHSKEIADRYSNKIIHMSDINEERVRNYG